MRKFEEVGLYCAATVGGLVAQDLAVPGDIKFSKVRSATYPPYTFRITLPHAYLIIKYVHPFIWPFYFEFSSLFYVSHRMAGKM